MRTLDRIKEIASFDCHGSDEMQINILLAIFVVGRIDKLNGTTNTTCLVKMCTPVDLEVLVTIRPAFRLTLKQAT